jgi:imidazolonepropionase-like amidohydrolase
MLSIRGAFFSPRKQWTYSGIDMDDFIRCGKLYMGSGTDILADQVLCIDGDRVSEVVPFEAFAQSGRRVSVDRSAHFVMPGLIDVHTHLAYGNAKTEEDIDLYGSTEFRALRGAFFSQRVLAAGYTSICSPGDSGNVSTAIRDAVDAGFFDGPSVTAAGPYITTRQGLTDWYPTWVGVPSSSIGRLVRSRDEAIEEVRRQAKDGVDMIKIALDGIQRRPDGEHIAAFTLDETLAMVEEIHRLGKIAVAHARGREATLYAGKAGVDLIFHCSYMDDECLDWVLRNGCAISPSLTLLKNTMDFSQAADPYHQKGRRAAYQIEYDAATAALQKARLAGVPMPTGTDTGFAVTPYGEWHARELQIYVEDLGFSAVEAMQAATSVSAAVLRPKDKAGRLQAGFQADLIVLRADPSLDIKVLMDSQSFVEIWKRGKRVQPEIRSYNHRQVSDFSMTMFSDIYTRARVAELASVEN